MATLFFFRLHKFHFPHFTLSLISRQFEVIATEVYNWGLTVYISRYPEELTAPYLFILNINHKNGRLGDPKDHPGYDCTADQSGPCKQGCKWCDRSKRFIGASNLYQREVGVLKL